MTAVLGELLLNYEILHNATPNRSFQDKGKILIFKGSKQGCIFKTQARFSQTPWCSLPGLATDVPDSFSRATGHGMGLCQTPEPGLWGVAAPPWTAAGRGIYSLLFYLPSPSLWGSNRFWDECLCLFIPTESLSNYYFFSISLSYQEQQLDSLFKTPFDLSLLF